MSGYAGLINATVDDLSLSDDWLNGLDADEQRALKAAFQNGVEIASDAILTALSAPAPQGIGREEIIRIFHEEYSHDCGWEQKLADRILALLPTEPPAQGEGR